MPEAGLNPIYAAAENLTALYDSVVAFDQTWRLTQEFTDPGSSVAASISCSGADALENLFSALGLNVLADQFREAHLIADADGSDDGYHEEWPETETEVVDYDDDDDDDDDEPDCATDDPTQCDGTCRN